MGTGSRTRDNYRTTFRRTTFALPKKLERDLARVLAYWDALKRGEAEVPFFDDVNVTSLPELATKLFMIDTLDKPMRFRFSFGVVGAEVKRAYGGDLDGRFLDEIEVRPPLQFLLSQCSATVESRRPTYYRQGPAVRPPRTAMPG